MLAVLEQRLEAPVVVVGLAGVGGQELAPLVHLVADGRHVVLVAAGSQKAEVFPGRGVLAQHALHVPFQGVLGQEGGGQVQLARKRRFSGMSS